MTSTVPHAPLAGLRVLNTRPAHQSQALSQAIVNAGGVCIDLPALSIQPTSLEWVNHLPNWKTVHAAIFTSPNAVTHFFASLPPRTMQIFTPAFVLAVGSGSAHALQEKGVVVSHWAIQADSEHLLQCSALQSIDRQSIVLIKGEGGRTLIRDTLLARGAHVQSILTYRRTLPVINPAQISRLWQNDAIDIILLTSEQAMLNLLALFGPDARPWLCSKPWVVISTRLEKIARTLGVNTVFTSRHDSLLDALIEIKGQHHDHAAPQ